MRREIGRERRIGSRVVVARPRALDRPRLAAPVGADAQERLGRRADELPAARVQIEVVRHGRRFAQTRVEIQRAGTVPLEPLRVVDLVDVAARDVVEHALDARAVVRVRHAAELVAGRRGARHRAHALQPVAQPAQLALGARDDPQLVALAVECVQRVDRRELDGRQPEVVARELRDRLERPGEVVAQRAEQPAGERRSARRHVGREPVEQRARLLQRARRIAPREHGGGPRREVRPAALSRLEQDAPRPRQRVQRRRRLDAARGDGVREHTGARSQSRAHAVTVAPARAPAPPPPRARAAPRADPAQRAAARGRRARSAR